VPVSSIRKSQISQSRSVEQIMPCDRRTKSIFSPHRRAYLFLAQCESVGQFDLVFCRVAAFFELLFFSSKLPILAFPFSMILFEPVISSASLLTSVRRSSTEMIDQLVGVFCDIVLKPFTFHNQPQSFDEIEVWGVRRKKNRFKFPPTDGFAFVPCCIVQDQ